MEKMLTVGIQSVPQTTGSYNDHNAVHCILKLTAISKFHLSLLPPAVLFFVLPFWDLAV